MQKNPKISCVVNTSTNDRVRPTDIVVKVYKNKIFIVATDYKKIGKLISVTQEGALQELESTTYDVTPIFGNSKFEESRDLAVAKYIAHAIEIDRPLLLSLALESYDKSVLTIIVAAIKKLKTW